MLNGNNKLSVIIPFCNSEKYIGKCIESVLNQTYKNIEVLLVGNCSTDNSISICESFASKDSRLRVIIEEKSGAAAARNRGIKESQGAYITFVDSDDYIEACMYEKLVDNLENTQSDMACCSFYYVYEDGSFTDWYEPTLGKYIGKSPVVTGRECANIFLTSRDIEGFCWNKLFRKSIICDHGLSFDESKIAFEDMLFIFNYLNQCKSIVLVDEKLYYYRQNSGSLTKDTRKERRVEFTDTVNKIVDKANEVGLAGEAKCYKAVRIMYDSFDKLRGGNKIKEYLPEEINFFSAAYLIIRYQKTEKIKTLCKLAYCLVRS